MTDQPNGFANQQGPPPPLARVIFEYDHATGATSFKTEGNFPFPHLINVMELAKAQFVALQLSQMSQRRGPAPNKLCMPDGSPPPLR